MKILQVHNHYQQAGGEDAVLAAEHALLSSRGHDVRIFTVSNDDILGLWNKFKTAWQIHYSPGSLRAIAHELTIFNPDIVHVHNFFPLLTPSIYDACIDAGVPVVQTLHNYRTICPGALLMQNGKICEKCITGVPYHAVVHCCYRNSFFGTIAVARMVAYHRKKNTWQNKVDRFIALTEFGKKKFIQAGFPPDKIAVKPNFYDSELKGTANDTVTREGALFVGRLSQEKGVTTMLRSWRKINIPLRVVGGGLLHDFVKGSDLVNISLLGQLIPRQVSKEMAHASFLVMPSEWYEGFPMVLVEAFAHGTPVIASRLGGMAEIVEDGITGLHFKPGNSDDLAEKIRWMRDHPGECRRMGQNARRVYEEKYTPEINHQILMAIYQQAIDEKNRN